MLLQADNLSFRYARDRPPAIDGVSVTVAHGASLGLVGPNGSGKTTLLRLLAGTLRPAAGEVRIDGRLLDSIGRRSRARRIAVVPQQTHPTFDYSALEIVLMGRYPWLGAFEVEGPDDLAAAFDALEATGTRHLATRAFPTLSGGEQQRVVIASVLAQLDPRHESSGGEPGPASVLFLDEPTASLDIKYQVGIAALLRRLHAERGITIVLSTHDLRMVASLCTTTILLSAGRVLASGPPSDTLRPDLVGRLFDIGADVAAPLLA